MDPNEKKPESEKSEVPQTDSRTAIMLKLAPVVEAALLDGGWDLNNKDILRRYFRAMVHLAIQKLLDAGAPPQFLVAQCIEAIGHELDRRQKMGENGNVPPSTALN